MTCIFRPPIFRYPLLRFSHNVCPPHVDSISLIACVCSPFLLPLGAPPSLFSQCWFHLTHIALHAFTSPVFPQLPFLITRNLWLSATISAFCSTSQDFTQKPNSTFCRTDFLTKSVLICWISKIICFSLAKRKVIPYCQISAQGEHQIFLTPFDFNSSVARVINNLLWLRVWRKTRKSNDKDDLIDVC